MWTAISAVFGNMFGLGSDYLKNKREEKQEVHEQKLTRIKQDGTWENNMSEGSKSSWKDEFWTIIFAIPLVMCFIPNCVEYVTEGFKALDGTPEWYRYCVLTLVGASVGVRKLTDIMKSRK